MDSLTHHPAQRTPVKWTPGRTSRWLFGGEDGPRNRFLPRWIFLRALAVFYFSAFYSLLFQIEGLIGPRGVLPAQRFLAAVQGEVESLRFWYAPTVFWFSSGKHAMMAVIWLGLIASVAAFCNLWPRFSFFICLVSFLSFVSAAQAFSSYQSDGMLLEAGFLALFFAPRGFLPGWGMASPPSRASLFLLQWEWFRIYFESGMVKLLSGDPQWRNYTAMDEYYQNGPLPTWIGWYVEHLPHWFHAATVAGTLGMELVVVWMLFLPRRMRLICFFIVTPWEIGVIVTANYTFLNYLVLALGFLLLDDRSVRWLLPLRFRTILPVPAAQEDVHREPDSLSILNATEGPEEEELPSARGFARSFKTAQLCAAAVMLTWITYVTTAEMIRMQWPNLLLPTAPVVALEPFRIANQYGLFAVMTRGRYEIEFQGSSDQQNWTPYLFRYKPQALNEAPRIYAPYQPRFEWNLWFASLGDWQQNNLVPLTEEGLLENDPDVLNLFRGNPFPQSPRYVRAVLWQYWFTSMDEKRRTGNWWKRNLMGVYAPALTRQPDGKFAVVQWPDELPPHD
ncbi:MAG: lipase maturation factor family protein [Terracidiphilus sp.]